VSDGRLPLYSSLTLLALSPGDPFLIAWVEKIKNWKGAPGGEAITLPALTEALNPSKHNNQVKVSFEDCIGVQSYTIYYKINLCLP
jgi:hypothetical protein